MQKYLLLFLAFFCLEINAQVAPSKYIVRFNDKNNSPYSVSTPSAFLTSRSIARRTRQNIPYLINDLPVNPQYLDSIRSTGATILNRSRWMNAATVFTTDTSVLNTILSFPFVQSAQPVQKRRGGKIRDEADKFGTVLEKAEGAASERILPFNYGASYTQINMIGGDYLHNLGYRGEGMVIAVLDAGFENADQIPVFDSIRNNNQILGTWDFVQNNSIVYDDHSHGTNVLSTMAGNLPGQLIGTAPKAGYWLLRSEEAATEFLVEEMNWVAAAEFADSVGADIINSSLGYTTFDDPSMDHTYADMNGNTTIITKGADLAASKGILVVNSAGNSGSSTWQYIGAPADADSILSIGAVDSLKVYVNFSSKGPTYDGRVKPNVCAQGFQTVLASPSGLIFRGNGTSFSSPIIAGMSACLWQANTSKNNLELIDAIERSADQYSNPDGFRGYGVPNFSSANLLLAGIPKVQVNESTLISVYPNPFKENFGFIYYAADSQQIQTELFDYSGKKLISSVYKFEGNSYQNIILESSSFLPAGVYLLRLSNGKNSFTRKVVKQ